MSSANGTPSHGTPTHPSDSRAVDSAGLFRSKRMRVVPFVVALALGAIGWWVQSTVEGAMRRELAVGLETILDADVKALEIWRENHERAAMYTAADPEFVAFVREVTERIAEGGDAEFVTDLPKTDRIRSLLDRRSMAHGYDGWVVLDSMGEVVFAMRDGAVGEGLEAAHEDCARCLRDGETVISHPFPARVALEDDMGENRFGVPTMFVATPIFGEQGETIGGLGLRIRPDKEFTQILTVAQTGRSGETYAFDGTGRLLSRSRFDDQLKSIGILPNRPEVQSILNVELRNPGVNLVRGDRTPVPRAEQPLTYAAQSAIDSGERGVDAEGHRDYRGVPVVAAWTWIEPLGLGVATQIDASEALRSLVLLRRAFWALFVALLLAATALLGFSHFALVFQGRMRRAQERVERLGQYTLEGLLGEGGMGEVYLARHVLLRRPTALKLLGPDRNRPEDIARFEREVRTMSSLTHPNTAAVFDYGSTPDGIFYYAMELLDGLDLATYVHRYGPMPEERVIHVLRQVCGSLEEAHEKGFVHRDIKPANIMLCRRGGVTDFVKVLDFGLVKHLLPDDGATALTQPELIVGTPQYLAPEAMEDDTALDPRSDLYSLGLVGWFLLVGRDMHEKQSAVAMLAQRLMSTPTPPSEVADQPISPDLEELVLRCLSRDPQERPGSARELEALLGACRSAEAWTRGDADLWWAERPDATEERRPRESQRPRSLAVALALRDD